MKKVSLLLLCVFAALSISAQESGVSAEAGRKATFARNGFWDNWFVGAGAAGSMYLGKNDQKVDIQDRITVNPTIMVGKWFNPYLGARVAGQAGSIHTFSNNGAKMYSNTHLNVHLDFMFNLTNYLCKYNENRFYNFIPTLGVGYDRRDADNHKLFRGRGFNGLTLNGGFLNTFRLSNRLSAFVELSGILVESKFDKGQDPKYTNGNVDPKNVGRMNWNGIANASAGLILKVGKVGFSEANLMDVGLLDDLNRQINDLRARNAELSKRPTGCPDCPPAAKPCPPIQAAGDVVVPNVVFFRLNSANVDKNQEISVYNTAEYLKSNPAAKVKVVGYADKQTGTANYNMTLSEKRAKNVAKALIEKYNISSDRVSVEWKGSSEQPYKENAWNRVAIFFAQ